MPPLDRQASNRKITSGEGGLPIAWLLPLVLAGLVLVTVIPVMLLGFFGARDNTNRLLRDRSELVLDSVVGRVAAHLGPVRAQLAYAAEAVRRGALDAADEPAMKNYSAGTLAGVPQVNGLSFVRPDLTVRRHNRAGHESFEDAAATLAAVKQGLAEDRTDPGPRWIGREAVRLCRSFPPHRTADHPP